jgi:hypothetical protein
MPNDLVIVDIDGTIAHHGSERGHFEYDKVGGDQPIEQITYLVTILWDHFDVVFLSGREDSCRQVTIDWIQWHVFGADYTVELHMRPTGDYRRDDVIKEELYKEFILPRKVAYVLEDRNRNVAMWRSLGLTCLQVADGDF